MSTHRSQIAGLALFSLSGLIFLVTGLRADDAWTATGSVVWLAGCAIWTMPHLRTPERDPAGDHD